MSTFIKKENLVISTGEYQKDGQTKQEWRTIGEIVTMKGDDNSEYQFFKMWGSGGVVEGKVFEQKDKNQQASQQPQGGFSPSGSQGGFSQQPQLGYYMSNGAPCPPQVVQALQMAQIQMWQQGTQAPQQVMNIQGWM